MAASSRPSSVGADVSVSSVLGLPAVQDGGRAFWKQDRVDAPGLALFTIRAMELGTAFLFVSTTVVESFSGHDVVRSNILEVQVGSL